MAEKLKPCPFCGGEVKISIIPVRRRRTVMFICHKCGANVNFFGAEYGQDAAEAWNRRADNA